MLKEVVLNIKLLIVYIKRGETYWIFTLPSY